MLRTDLERVRNCRWSFFDGYWRCQSPKALKEIEENTELVDCYCITCLSDLCEEREDIEIINV